MRVICTSNNGIQHGYCENVQGERGFVCICSIPRREAAISGMGNIFCIVVGAELGVKETSVDLIRVDCCDLLCLFEITYLEHFLWGSNFDLCVIVLLGLCVCLVSFRLNHILYAYDEQVLFNKHFLFVVGNHCFESIV